ncbi:hypothetical protein CAAU_1435 [Caloramator australicus RC3]|uniref:PD-(D/E)XK endonuclease-like domain-containing protein n=2 Tax=Caloramator TaxID=44258 RepID=I7K7K7_9CLOT|nr:hypothetical protein CAAU_1435 [Caloramator australicus RC3]
MLPKEWQTADSLMQLLKRHWVSDGYKNSKIEENFLKRAQNMLLNYCSERRDMGNIILCEEFLKQDINKNLILLGKIDKLYLNENGILEVLDYKAGYTALSKEEFENNIQLPIYALLTKYRFNKLPKVISYYYLVPNQKISIELTKTILENGIYNLKKVINEILSEKDFPYNSSNNCKNSCEYYNLCEAFNVKAN